MLLESLIRRAGMVVPRAVLVEEGWGLGADVSDANLYFFVRALRSKITAPGEQELLHTVRGVELFHAKRELMPALRSISLRLHRLVLRRHVRDAGAVWLRDVVHPQNHSHQRAVSYAARGAPSGW